MTPVPSNQPTDPNREHPTLSSALLAGVKAMEPDGWSRLVTTFGPIVYRWCRSSGVAESDAPDVVQEVFASVARGIASFHREKESGSFRSWLATITRNRVRDYFRRQKNRQPAAGGTEALTRLRDHAEELSAEEELTKHLESTICPNSIQNPIVKRELESVRDEFQSTTWEAFWATTVDGESASEVASRTGLSVASVYQAKSRVLRRLRKRLADLPL